MSCLVLSAIIVGPAMLGVAVPSQAGEGVSIVSLATLSATPAFSLALTAGVTCSVGGGELTVLAASDGILRTRDGDFLILDPSQEN